MRAPALLALAAVAHAGRSTFVRAPAETPDARLALSGVGAQPFVRVDLALPLDAGSSSASSAWAPLRAHIEAREALDDLDALVALAEEEAPPSADWSCPLERARAEEEEREMWRALLSCVSSTGEVAGLFRELVGGDDDEADDQIEAPRRQQADELPPFDVELPLPKASRSGAENTSASALDSLALHPRLPRRRSTSEKPPRPLPLPPAPSVLSARLDTLREHLATLLPSSTHPRRTRSAPAIDPQPFRLLA